MQEASFDHTLEQYQKNCLDNLQTWSHDLEEAKELLLKQKTEEFDEKIKTMSLDVNLDQSMNYFFIWTWRLKISYAERDNIKVSILKNLQPTAC